MGEYTDKAKGYANEAIGNVKEEVGKIIGNENLQVEGIVQEGKGAAQVLKGKAEGAAKDLKKDISE
nr:CsbD family protein [uncultured Sphingomonas sp.]